MYIQEFFYTIDFYHLVIAVVVCMAIATGCLVGWAITRKKEVSIHTTTEHAVVKQGMPIIHVHTENVEETIVVTEDKKVKAPLKKTKKIIVR